MSERMREVFSEFRGSVNTVLSSVKEHFVTIPDRNEFIYMIRFKTHLFAGAPTITLQAHTRPKTVNDAGGRFELLDGDNVITCTIEVRASSMNLTRESGVLGELDLISP